MCRATLGDRHPNTLGAMGKLGKMLKDMVPLFLAAGRPSSPKPGSCGGRGAMARSLPLSECVAPSPAPGGLVASVALTFGVPTETLCTILLISFMLFIWRRGDAFLRYVGVLSLTATLTTYALFRRVRRALPFPRLCAAALVVAGVALAVSPPEARSSLQPSVRALVSMVKG